LSPILQRATLFSTKPSRPHDPFLREGFPRPVEADFISSLVNTIPHRRGYESKNRFNLAKECILSG
jgi:hypothetical protein